jgi:hypothetical protein
MNDQAYTEPLDRRNTSLSVQYGITYATATKVLSYRRGLCQSVLTYCDCHATGIPSRLTTVATLPDIPVPVPLGGITSPRLVASSSTTTRTEEAPPLLKQ